LDGDKGEIVFLRKSGYLIRQCVYVRRSPGPLNRKHWFAELLKHPAKQIPQAVYGSLMACEWQVKAASKFNFFICEDSKPYPAAGDPESSQ
jgi:hypothetical protein